MTYIVTRVFAGAWEGNVHDIFHFLGFEELFYPSHCAGVGKPLPAT